MKESVLFSCIFVGFIIENCSKDYNIFTLYKDLLESNYHNKNIFGYILVSIILIIFIPPVLLSIIIYYILKLKIIFTWIWSLGIKKEYKE